MSQPQASRWSWTGAYVPTGGGIVAGGWPSRGQDYPGMAANGGDQELPRRHGRVGQYLWKGWLGVIIACECTPGTWTG